MKRFNILDPQCPLLGPHLLEASAGTGKTFTIEHVVVRLVLENIPISKILVVTFTKASTRELKERIFRNFQKARDLLQAYTDGLETSPKQESFWQGFDYLQKVSDFHTAKILLSNAISGFDESQIFTIHGFCFRMLQEFSFEANVVFPLQDPDHPVKNWQKLQSLLHRFWGHETKDIVCSEQIGLLFSKYETYQGLCSFVCKSDCKDVENSYAECFLSFKEIIQQVPGNLDFSFLEFWEDFCTFSMQYKSVKGDFKAQLQALFYAFQGVEIEKQFRQLLLHQGSLWDLLSKENRKVRIKESKPCRFGLIFSFIAEQLGPVIMMSTDKKQIAKNLGACFKSWIAKQSDCQDLYNPDEILWQMRSCLDSSFIHSVQQKYKAVIVDEFQDTDPIQFDIFYECFIKDKKYEALYLVGDPKQSIYRFRNADIYTFIRAKELLGDENVYHLGTNFRSTKRLIDSLNVLFSRHWLTLPKRGESLEYIPVLSGSKEEFSLEDGKKSLHWMVGGKESSFEETFLPYVVAEICRLNPENLSKVAILVKDRFEASFAKKRLLENQIPCVCKSHQPISESFWFQSVREFIYAVLHPHNEMLVAIYEKGPFYRDISLVFLHDLLLRQGLSAVFSRVFEENVLHPELKQVVEELLEFETREGFSVLGCEKFFHDVEKYSAEEGFSVKNGEQENAVQILTLHISKGLEFDFVFALALASKSPRNAQEDAEVIAEKLRLLYVAMTRAKKRLYVPWIQGGDSTSAMDLFVKQVTAQEGCFKTYLEKLSTSYCISLESVATPFAGVSKLFCKEEKPSKLGVKKAPYFPPITIESFSSLAKVQQREDVIEIDPLDLPKGRETGIVIHGILERIFSSQESCWKHEEKIASVVFSCVQQTPYSPFIEIITRMIVRAFTTQLVSPSQSFTLQSIEKEAVFTEFEFLYQEKGRFITGFIDLVFAIGNNLYIVDWKTNVLRDNSAQAIVDAMHSHDYFLQAALYQEAMMRYFGSEYIFSGVFYLFLRSGQYQYVNAVDCEI